MPKQNINFENSLIYKIFCKDEKCKDIYVGQTTDFIRRKYAHKNGCHQKNEFLYNIIRDNGGWDNWNMEVVEKIPAKTKQEILDREQYWINELQANLNINVRYDPSEYKREWYFKNRQRIQEFKKKREEGKTNFIKGVAVLRIAGYDFGNITENPPDWYLENVKNQKYIK